MKIFDFNNFDEAARFYAKVTKLGWTCSSVWQDDGYTVNEDRIRVYVGRYHILSNYPYNYPFGHTY